jgi:hypothetical protein
MRLASGSVSLIVARARRRPGRFVLPALGLALATAFAGAVAAESVIAGDQAARSALDSLPPLQRTVSAVWQGPVTAPVEREARRILGGLGLGPSTQAVLLNPVRLSGIIVRPAAIEPLGRWVGPAAAARVGRCRAGACPMLLASGVVTAHVLAAAGVRIPVVGHARLNSPVPLGFTPAADVPPVLLTGDVAGLDTLGGLSGVYRAHLWSALLATSTLHSWQLAGVEQHLEAAQAALLATAGQFTLDAPFDGLDAARSEAADAPRRLLLTGGGALAALVLFIVLAAGSLRRDQHAELERLRMAGARSSQCVAFVLGEAAWLSALGLLVGALVAVAAASLLARAAGEPVGEVLAHSLLTPTGAIALAVGWLCATALVATTLLAPGARAADVLAVGAAAAVALALADGGTGNDTLTLLLAPLCCLAAGVLVFRGAALLLRTGERLLRRGPVLGRLAFLGLARSPAAPALAIAFIAVSTGLGAFALAYRATLVRGSSDQAANQVPLDALVAAGPDFTTPLEVAPLTRWQALAGGTVLPVRRTQASYAGPGATVTVPALGVPASGLPALRGWRRSDASTPLDELARRLVPPGPARVPGPTLPAGSRWLTLRLASPALAVGVTADLRAVGGEITQLQLGSAGSRPATSRTRIPPGHWELEALELDEPSGVAATNGHQNAENPAPSTQFSAAVTLGPLRAIDRTGRVLATAPIGRWLAIGAASRDGAGGSSRAASATTAMLGFQTTGFPGLLRPAQPSDFRPVPILVDPQTAAAAGRRGILALTIDELPVRARVVGVLNRFPTIPSGSAGFVVADEATLASALDAQLPGQGRPDELWISTSHLARLRAALATGSLSQLQSTFRADIEHQLETAPVARGMLGTLVAAAAVCGVLAVLGLLVALLGAGRDRRIERDLLGQGIGPHGLRDELRVRLMLAGALGVACGLAIGLLLTRLAVATVQAAAGGANPDPPLVTIAPWGALAVWTLTALAVLGGATWLATTILRPSGEW